MIRIQQIKLEPGHDGQALYERAARLLHIKTKQISRLVIRRQSIDARKKPDIFYSYVVDVALEGMDEKKCVQRCHSGLVSIAEEKAYCFPARGSSPLKKRPVIIGTGPAGLFCGYMLAQYGYRPILLERGKDVEARKKDVEHFWNCGELDTESNVSFGEGGAGTFSDGKLNTLVKDRDGRGNHVLSVFVENGAQPEILYEAKPHIGTDVLTDVVKNMRQRIENQGGEVRFLSRVDGFLLGGMDSADMPENAAAKKAGTDEKKEPHICGVVLADGSVIETNLVVLAIGHSARDTFEWLLKAGVSMESKSFAVGLRVEHPQKLMNRSQYGEKYADQLPPAPYKVTAKAQNGRGVYSFCMCPGGYVVNASSEQGHLAVNGMSYSKRDAANANSAIIVSVTPRDYPEEGPLAGIAFQRELEKKAWLAGKGNVPVQRYGDFSDRATKGHISPDFCPCIKGNWRFSDVASVLPPSLREAFRDGMEQFGRMIEGFDDQNAFVEGIESRTSSPVRIGRDETLQSNIRGLYPCGEGAGYAGGITSAAMDGVRIAEVIAAKYAPFER